MRAIVFNGKGRPLELKELPKPVPKQGQILIKVLACGVCRTDLHILDGELNAPKLPLVIGHQIVGQVVALGDGVSDIEAGDRVGVPWLGGTCGTCEYCVNQQENLCNAPTYTGYQIDGGFAEYCVANSPFVFRLPSHYSDIEVAPLLCAGLIGYRALRFTKNAKKIGFYGFGSSAHLLTQVSVYQKRHVYAFTKKGDSSTQSFAKKLGAVWAGSAENAPPTLLDAAIIFAPAGELVISALKAVKKGSPVVCAGIHMSDIPSFPYSLLWEERTLTSVANLTRQDGEELLHLAPKIPIKTAVTVYPLEQVPQALEDLRNGAFNGAAVISFKTLLK